MTPIRDAATVIVACDAADGPLVYMVRRSARSVFLPERYVFPGGAVDAQDREEAERLVVGAGGEVDRSFVLAAARETFEEAGMLFADRAIDGDALATLRRAVLAGEVSFGGALARAGARIDASALRLFSHWITPPGEPRRFDTRFFVARAPRDQVAEADAAEVHDGRWFAPRQALDAWRAGEIGLIFPTIKHLERIAPYRTVDELLAFAAAKPIVTISPEVSGEREFSLAPEVEGAW